ncbi:MAG: hypothetical protein WCE80_08660 [Acidimicrobiia bacterium]
MTAHVTHRVHVAASDTSRQVHPWSAVRGAGQAKGVTPVDV